MRTAFCAFALRHWYYARTCGTIAFTWLCISIFACILPLCGFLYARVMRARTYAALRRHCLRAGAKTMHAFALSLRVVLKPPLLPSLHYTACHFTTIYAIAGITCATTQPTATLPSRISVSGARCAAARAHAKTRGDAARSLYSPYNGGFGNLLPLLLVTGVVFLLQENITPVLTLWILFKHFHGHTCTTTGTTCTQACVSYSNNSLLYQHEFGGVTTTHLRLFQTGLVAFTRTHTRTVRDVGLHSLIYH